VARCTGIQEELEVNMGRNFILAGVKMNHFINLALHSTCPFNHSTGHC